jgi:hypothetical protein
LAFLKELAIVRFNTWKRSEHSPHTTRSTVLTQRPADIKHAVNETAENNCHDLAFTLLQDSISVQFTQVDSLDAKANAAQVSASTLVGAALVFQAVLLGGNSTLQHRFFQVATLFPLLVAYAFVMYYSSRGYSIGDYKRVPAPGTLLQNLHMAESKMKQTLLSAMGEAFALNESKINEKVHVISLANRALQIETGVLIAALLVQTVLPAFPG